jgi:cysteine-rich repeat protein
MKLLCCAAFVGVVALGCNSKPAFELPGTHASGVSGAGSAVDAGMALVAECDQAPDGTPCGKPGQPTHCIYNVCVRNACGDGVVAEAEQCDDGNQRDHDGCDSHCRKEPAPRCGDGVVDPGEACDDGNTVDTDACTNMCQYARCGDGIVEAGVEECDDGNQINSDSCLDNCKRARCGDGYVGPGEQCDNGATGATATCDATCKIPVSTPVCGNATVDPGEQCDLGAGMNTPTSACPNCKNAVCGDGLVEAGVEQCDDGNMVDTDGCTNACQNAVCGDGVVGPGEHCDLGAGNNTPTSACPSCQTASCGDGLVQAGVEQCDLGAGMNTTTGACPSCKNAVCGDGFVEAGVEQCDNGAASANATCDATCKVPAGSPVCGNGTVDPGEECDLGAGKNTTTSACPNCKHAKCGDGFVETGVEQCDGQSGASGALGLGQVCASDCLSVTDNCLACEVTNCTDYMGAGVDLVAGCYHDPNPTFVQQCVDAVDCARTKNCAYTARGAEQCYCGSASSAQCQLGTGIDGACKTQFETAAGSSSAQVVTGHFGDRSLPIGNAVFMLQCDRDFCGARSTSGAPTQCVP